MCADRDRNGVLDVNEFLIGIRGELSERRKKFVRMAFNTLDKDRSGIIRLLLLLPDYPCEIVLLSQLLSPSFLAS